MDSAADPEALRTYRSAAVEIADLIDSQATSVADAVTAFGDSGPEYGAGVGSGLSDRITARAAEHRFTDEWVGEVAEAFASADGRTGTELDAYITAQAGQPTIIQQQAADDAAAITQLIGDNPSDEEIVAAMAGYDANHTNAEYSVAFFEALGPEGVVALDERLAEVRQETGRYATVNEFVDDAEALRQALVEGYSLASQPTDPGRDGVVGVGVLTPAFHEAMVGAAGYTTLLQFTGQYDTAPMTDAFLVAAGQRIPEIDPSYALRGPVPGASEEDLLANIAATSPDAAATLLHDPEWSDWLFGGDTDTYGDGRVVHWQWHGTDAFLMASLGEMPQGHTWAEEDFDRLVREHWSDEVSDELRVTLAFVSGNFFGGLPDRFVNDEAAIADFFEQVTKNDEALGVLSLALGVHTSELLDSGIAQMVEAGPDGLLPADGLLGDEFEEISSLYGLVGDGLENAAERGTLLGGFFQFAGGAAKTIGFAAGTTTGPWWAAAGVGVDGALQLGAGLIDGAGQYDGVTAEQFVNENFTSGVRANVALSLYDNAAIYPELAEDLGNMTPPPESLREPLPPDASQQQRQDYNAALQEWLNLPQNRALEDYVDTFAGGIEGRILDELELDPG